MSPEEIQGVLAYMLSAWPSAKVDDATPLVWAEHLLDVSYEAGMRAAKRLVKESQWFPSISDFLECARLERLALKAAPSRELYECRSCLAGRGFIVTDEQPLTGHPCPECRREAYERWASGAYRPQFGGGRV